MARIIQLTLSIVFKISSLGMLTVHLIFIIILHSMYTKPIYCSIYPHSLWNPNRVMNNTHTSLKTVHLGTNPSKDNPFITAYSPILNLPNLRASSLGSKAVLGIVLSTLRYLANCRTNVDWLSLNC